MIRVDKIIPGGFGLATAESGKKLLLLNTLPDEEVIEYNITKRKSHYEEGIAVKVANPSPHRISPRDDCYLSTSPFQIMEYDYELSLKRDLVVEIFREHGISIAAPEVVTDGCDYFYRNKMEYSLYYDHDLGRILPSFHARGSHRKIPIMKSSIERPEIFAAATRIIDDLNARGEDARKYQSLLLRCNQNSEVSGGLYENGKPHPTFPELIDTILGRTYSYSPNGFFQINLPVYEMALEEMKKHVNTSKVLDLYSGVGTIGLSIARDHKLTLVEVDKFAFGEMVKNIGTKSGNILAIHTESENATDYISPDTTVILDPPRAGCDSKLVNKLLEVTPPTIIYLSCNPATQARDIKILLAKYHIASIKTFNFFPRTPHIENLIILNL